MKLFIAASLLGLGAANIANIAEKACLDIKAMCKDGSDKKGCERRKAEDLTKGANLQMWQCHNEDNQQFELIDGRLHNTLTKLCIDIKANCVDKKGMPVEEKTGCQRQALKDIKEDANVQLWTCRKDDAAGKASRSYGNQKFDLMKDGTFRNEATNLCLTVDKSKKDKVNGANVKVEKCKEGNDDQSFIFKPTVDVKKDFTRLVEVQDSSQLQAPAANGSHAAFSAMAVGACASVLLAAVAVFRSKHSTPEALPMD